MTTSADTILAIDLGRFKSVACVYSRSTRNHAFRTIDSKPDALAPLLAEHPGSLVVIEACANAGWVHDQAVAAGHTVKVANTSSAKPTTTTPSDSPNSKRSVSFPRSCCRRRPCGNGEC